MTRGERTRRRLLDAATQVFDQRGYHAARVDDIVKAAKTSHGTFYLYFANKEQLFHALASEVAVQMRALAEELGPIGPGKKGERALRDWLERFTDLYVQYAPVLRAWTEAEIAGDSTGELGEELLGGFSVRLADLLVESDGDVDPAIAGGALLAMIERVNYYALTEQVQTSRDEMLDVLARTVHAIVRPKRS